MHEGPACITSLTVLPSGVTQDYVMVISAESFSDDLVDISPIDKSVDFINKCGKNNYDIRYRSCVTRIRLCIIYVQ